MSESRLANVQNRIRLYSDWYKVVFPFNRLNALFGWEWGRTLHVRGGPTVVVHDVFSDDLPIISEVLGKDSYQLSKLALPERAVVVDVGANIGVFALAVKQRFPSAQIFAYEPHPDNFAFLKKNAPFATCFQEAVAGSHGEVHIEASGNSSALKLADQGIPVPAVKLDEALAGFSRVNLLKVDIEGAEYEVFQSASGETLAKINAVVMEIHKEAWKPWFVELFSTHGFKTRWISEALLFAEK